jgi:hypothetical protein
MSTPNVDVTGAERQVRRWVPPNDLVSHVRVRFLVYMVFPGVSFIIRRRGAVWQNISIFVNENSYFRE